MGLFNLPEERKFNLGYEVEFCAPLEIPVIIKELAKIDVAVQPVHKHPDGYKIYDRWFFTNDRSVKPPMGMYGYELVSPVMQYGAGLQKMKSIFNLITMIGGQTNESTGFHIGLSFADPFKMQKIDQLKLILLLNESEILRKFNRIDNRYCQSHKKNLRQNVKAHAEAYLQNHSERYNIDNEQKIRSFVHMDKYHTVNLLKLSKGYLEFRAMGGWEYHCRYNEIVQTIDHYMDIMEASVDPSKLEGKYRRAVNNLIRANNRIILRSMRENENIQKAELEKQKAIRDQAIARQTELDELLNNFTM